jgi:hypothetical protein
MIHTAAQRCHWIQYLMGNISMSSSLFFSSPHGTFYRSRVDIFAKFFHYQWRQFPGAKRFAFF